MSVNIAIDGPAGAGKSSLAKSAAKELGYIYVDTGAIYRSIAYYTIKKGADTKNASEVTALLGEITPSLRYIDGVQHVFVNDEDVSEHIRTPEVSMGASDVSRIPEVRSFLLSIQKDIAEKNNVIMDGRDIGTVILPNADVKIFLTASPEVRAKRRCLELEEKGQSVSYERILAEIIERDNNDMNRETAPLRQADDAVLLDTSEMDFEHALERLLEIVKEGI